MGLLDVEVVLLGYQLLVSKEVPCLSNLISTLLGFRELRAAFEAQSFLLQFFTTRVYCGAVPLIFALRFRLVAGKCNNSLPFPKRLKKR
jgi:hypothetical protein